MSRAKESQLETIVIAFRGGDRIARDASVYCLIRLCAYERAAQTTATRDELLSRLPADWHEVALRVVSGAAHSIVGARNILEVLA